MSSCYGGKSSGDDDHQQLYMPDPEASKKALIGSMEEYKAMYDKSVKDPEGFWAEIAEKNFHWEKKWSKVKEENFDLRAGTIGVKWFIDGKTNLCYNAVDRHLETKRDKVAILYEGNDANVSEKYTFGDLHERVCKFANVLKNEGVKKGDRVCIYLPMCVELATAMLACARIGAVHSVVFAGFSAEALADRIIDSKCTICVTADGSQRGPKPIPLKAVVDDACKQTAGKGHVVARSIVLKHEPEVKVEWDDSRDRWWHELEAKVDADCPVEWMDSEDPLFMLYTSGSTGKPKGVLHTTGGYMVYATTTHKYIFDIHDDDVYWCTADCGWITGHSYVVYGPLCNGATTLVFEGVPTYPTASRCWDVVDKHNVTIFYTAPTAIRALMRCGDDAVTSTSRRSLRLLGTVGEPINPEAWRWYYNIVGNGVCPIVDTWWQTETGGILITPLPGCTPLKPGSATLPFFGAQPVVLNDDGEELSGACSGYLGLKTSWPSLMRTVYGDHQRYEDTYFSLFKGYYATGDGCRRDEDGYFWITGRVDDVINVSGHRMGTAEVESALVLNKNVAEAAVVGCPHDIKGQGIYAYVTVKEGVEMTKELVAELKSEVRKHIGPIATPDIIHWAPGLPKTRSGKIMRRVLKKIAAKDTDNMGDTSTLADPTVVASLLSTIPE